MVLNKYKVYFVVLIIGYLIFYFPKIVHLITYSHTTGLVTRFESEYVSRSRGRGYYKNYPVIEFTTKQYRVTFAAPSFMAELVSEGYTVPVIYDPDQPENAYANTFLGYWGPEAVWLLPLTLMWTGIMLGKNFIPKYIKVY
jgi:hypothetical protein